MDFGRFYRGRDSLADGREVFDALASYVTEV
jgi:hypothetical protein